MNNQTTSLLSTLARVACAALPLTAVACSTEEAPAAIEARPVLGGDSALVSVFEDAGRERGVPAELLAAVSFVETRLRMAGAYGEGAHDGHSQSAIGLLALGEGGARDASRAAELAGLDLAAVHTDERASVQAAAALLADLAGPDRTGWHDALVAYGGGVGVGERFAAQVEDRLARGFRGRDLAGAMVVVSGAARRGSTIAGGIGSVTQGLGYDGAIWDPAYAGNYSAASRGADQINYIVIHTIQGSYGSAISWFRDPAAQVSAHYVVRSSDGEVTQMVDDSDVAWHVACFNNETIGIEHEGFVDDPGTWYSESMYLESARLTADLAERYGIPKDRDHIFGHGEAPDCSDHSDPGPGWDWDHYMALVGAGGAATLDAAYVGQSAPTVMRSGEETTVYVDMTNTSNITWGLDETRLGTTDPMDRESAFFVPGSWLGPNRATGADHSDYAPGSVGRFSFKIRAPEVTSSTTFDEHFQLVQEGVAWFGPKIALTIQVEPAGAGAPGAPGGGGPVGSGDAADEGADPEGDAAGVAGGCAAGGGTSLPACVILGAGVVAVRRRRSRARA